MGKFCILMVYLLTSYLYELPNPFNQRGFLFEQEFLIEGGGYKDPKAGRVKLRPLNGSG